MTEPRGEQAQQIQDLFSAGPDPGAGDIASQMISKLFGDQWWEILWSGKELQGEPSLVIPILNVFNVTILFAVTLILIYVVTHAFVGSAHEGTPLGKRLHSIWVPVRSVLSISLLAPIPWAPVLNFIQGIMLVFIGFSINMANLATDAGINYLVKRHGQVVATAPTDLTDAGVNVAKVGLANYLLQYHQYWFQENERLTVGYDKHIKPPRDGILGIGARDYTMINYIFRNPEPFSEDVMGGVTIKCKDPNSDLCRAKQSAVETLLARTEEVASRKVEQLYGEDSRPPEPQMIVKYVEDYGHTILKAVTARITQDNPELDRELEQFADRMEHEGFAMLGSYFWTMSRFSTALQDQVSSKVSSTGLDSKLLFSQVVLRFNQIDISLSAMDSYCRQFEHSYKVAELGNGSINKAEDGGGLFAAIGEIVSRPFIGATDLFIRSISSGDPVSSLSAVGRHLINGSIAAVGAVIGVYSAAGASSGFLEGIPVLGALGGAADGVVNGTAGAMIATIVLVLLAPVFLLGFTLAYYLPAVPFIIWSVALIGWVIMVLEAMIAAPVWAAMHANPDGEGIAGDKASQGYLMFLQVLLRPLLMVIGFFFALLLIHVISYVGGMFSVFFHGLAAEETVIGPITAAAGIFMGSILVVILVHKAFHLVYALPERLNEWIGNNNASQMGEGEDLRESKQVMVGAVGTHSSRSVAHAGNQAAIRQAGPGGGQGGESSGQDSQAADLASGETGQDTV